MTRHPLSLRSFPIDFFLSSVTRSVKMYLPSSATDCTFSAYCSRSPAVALLTFTAGLADPAPLNLGFPCLEIGLPR